MLMPTCMREPFGLVLIEAMMHGLNVIAPDAYGPAEILTDGVTGWLFATGSASEQVQRMQEIWLHLMENPETVRRVSLRARHQARSRYVLSQVKSEVLQVLQQVVERARITSGSERQVKQNRKQNTERRNAHVSHLI